MNEWATLNDLLQWLEREKWEGEYGEASSTSDEQRGFDRVIREVRRRMGEPPSLTRRILTSDQWDATDDNNDLSE